MNKPDVQRLTSTSVDPSVTPGGSESKKRALERTALVFAACVIGVSIWFWHAQIQSVLEILEMAYG